jgi:FAD/FMN-containing dehydrogenase
MVMPPAVLTSPLEEAAEQLQDRILGRVFLPGQPGYDTARKAWNLTVDQHPAAILVATSPWDVVEAMHFARETHLGIAVQSTGHGVARPADGALLIITSELTYVQIDAETQTAWVEAGALWHMVLEKAQAVGLAPLLGSSSYVGVVGYTLGGGMGWLARKYGLAADSVRYFEVVTADGQRRRVSPTENSELFWGLRGGGGSFGVITGMEIQLYPITTVYGGNLFYPVEAAKGAFQFFRDWTADAPEELTSSISIMNMPPLPQIPAFMRGKTVIVVRAVHAGDVEAGEALVQKWLDWMPPMANTFRAMPFSEIDSVSNDPKDPSSGHSSGAWLRDLSDEAIDVIVARSVSMNGSSPLVMTEIRHAGGAISKINVESAAFGNRDATLLMHMVAITPSMEALEYARQYIDQFQIELAPHLTGSVYINFLEGKEARERTRDAYRPEAYRRLKVLKAEYDPDNRFRYSFDIPPMKAD